MSGHKSPKDLSVKVKEKSRAIEELSKLVFEYLKRDFSKDPFYAFMSGNSEFDERDVRHTCEVMRFQEELFDPNKLKMSFDPDYPPESIAVNAILNELTSYCEQFSGEHKKLINAALWHDIGKGILRARHAMEGADYIQNLNDGQRKDLKENAKIDDNTIQLFADLIRYHDYFGVLATGEASPLLFSDVLYPVSNQSISTNRHFLALLLLLNIADARSAIRGHRIPYEKLEVYLHDLHRLTVIDDELKEPNRRRYSNVLTSLKSISICETQERIRRLLRQGILKFMETRYADDPYRRLVGKWFTLNDYSEINWAFNVFGLTDGFHEQFALTCRLDYGLGFVEALVTGILDRCMESRALDPEKDSSVHSDIKKECAVVVLEIISKLVGRYGVLTKEDKRVGLEMQFLGKQRDQVGDRTKEGTDTLVNKVLSRESIRRTEAINKVVNETLSWIL